VVLGKNRKWMGGSGRNIPSFEIFISPDCQGTEGHIYFTEPLYRFIYPVVEPLFYKGILELRKRK